MEFHAITDKGAVLVCTVEGRQVTIPGDSAVIDSPPCTEKSNDCAPPESG